MGWSILIYGFLVGLKHAVEADHVAAVVSLAARFQRPGALLRVGVLWGLGHAVTLLGVGLVLLTLDGKLSDKAAHTVEAVVGGMLVLLGADLLRRMARERIHFHVHHHQDGRAHLHVHAHAGQSGHGSHNHTHAQVRVLIVGLVHGLSGSAALVLLAVHSLTEFYGRIFYLLLFGLGSLVGMGLLSLALSVPLGFSARHFTRFHTGLMAGVSVITILLGLSLLVRHGPYIYPSWRV
ncbi:MAG: urease accessory protein [Deltaproteobacteria bacterium]|nr:urease accessory protein [Deltaproteobacteria bacterium]